jgi:hypothetical protein
MVDGKYNNKIFFDKISQLFQHGFLESQVEGIGTIIEGFFKFGLTDERWLAYMLGTVYHETSKTMFPLQEYGKGAGHNYGKKIKMSGRAYASPDEIYFGRGFIQLTWYENYEMMGRLLGIDLLNNPELALHPSISAQIMFEGMTKGHSSFGDFTGKCLEMYFNEEVCDWVNARKIINGLDCSEKIAEYSKIFYTALTESKI